MPRNISENCWYHTDGSTGRPRNGSENGCYPEGGSTGIELHVTQVVMELRVISYVTTAGGYRIILIISN